MFVLFSNPSVTIIRLDVMSATPSLIVLLVTFVRLKNYVQYIRRSWSVTSNIILWDAFVKYYVVLICQYQHDIYIAGVYVHSYNSCLNVTRLF